MRPTVDRSDPAAITITADDGTVRTWTLAEWEEDSARCIAATGNGFLRAVPDTIDAASARMLLRRIPHPVHGDMRAAVETMMTSPDADPDLADMWKYRPVLARNHPALNAMAAALGLSGEQVDDLFRAGAVIAV